MMKCWGRMLTVDRKLRGRIKLTIVGALSIASLFGMSQGPELVLRGEDPQTSRHLISDVQTLNVQFVETADLAFERTGTVQTLTVREGDVVQADELLLSLQSELAEARLAIAAERAMSDDAIQVAKKAQETATLERSVIAEANRNGPTFPAAQVQRLNLAEQASGFEVKLRQHEKRVAELEMKLAKADLETRFLKAPFSGIVTRVLKSQGEAVREGEMIIQLVNPSRFVVEVNVPIQEALQMKTGMLAEFRVDLPDAELALENRRFQGVVTFVDLSVQTVRERIRVTAEFENEDLAVLGGIPGRLRVFNQNVKSESTNKRSLKPTSSTIFQRQPKLDNNAR